LDNTNIYYQKNIQQTIDILILVHVYVFT
jgi:hypothetical protein